ncbi:MAG: YceI family protein [Solirubrobacteraceae bacterium]
MSTSIDPVAELPVSDGVWSIEPHRSEIGFAVKAMYGLMTVRGVFGACDGTLTVGTDSVAGQLAIRTDSLDTGNRKRDRHLRSSDFFDAERNPQIMFTTTAVIARDRGLTLTGELTIGSECQPLEIPVDVVPTADGAVQLDGRTTISRAAIGIAWNRLGMIGDDAQVSAQLTLTRAPT